MIKAIGLLILMLATSNAYSWEFNPASLDHMSLDAAKFGCNRNAMTPDIPCDQYKGRLRLNFNLGLFNDLVKWRNEVHTEGTKEKLVTVGWRYQVAIPLPGNLEIFADHHSQHTMDQMQPTIEGRSKPERFQVEDSYGLRIIFFEKVKR